MKYKTILLDSGWVLNKPVTGHWMISPNFFKYIDRNQFYKISKKKRRYAFRSAMQYIHSIEVMENIDIEFNHFCEYYRLLFNHLAELNISDNQIIEVAKDLVYNYDKYTFFSDAIEVVPKLKEHFTLSVVSDAWPSLDEVFKYNDFYKYFDSFINSSRIGVTKPNVLMYTSALDATNHRPSEAVFVDDRIKNCDGAKDVSIKKTYLLCRNKLKYVYCKLTVKEHTVVMNLHMVYDDLLKTHHE